MQLRKYIPELDALRAFAILAVIARHSLGRARIPYLTAASLYGWSGVDLFFVLSGFLITGILLDSKGTEHFFRNFYMRRALRIWPLYYVCLILIFFVLPRLFPPLALSRAEYPVSVYAVYLQNTLLHSYGSTQVSALWSLAVEEQFYFVWPFLVFLFSPKALRRILITLVIGAPVLRLVSFLHGADDFFTHTFTLCRVDSLAMGGLLACWTRSESCSVERLRRVSALTFAIGFGLLLGTRVLSPSSARGVAEIHEVLLYSFLAVAFTGLLGLALVPRSQASLFGWLLNQPALRYIGKISYGLYLLHYPLFNVVQLAGPLPLQLLTRYAVLLLVASVSWYAFEQPILRLKARFGAARA
jgi:peptidoglycan/LPS O-acetylase OafA/YrhL